MPLLSTIGAAAARAFGFLRSLISGYNVANSLRFNRGSSDSLTRTPASSGNRRTYTISTWLKRTKLSTAEQFIGASTTNFDTIGFDSSDKIRFYIYNNPTSTVRVSTQVFRDVGAWYHIVIAVDTTNATDQNRCRIYVNGTEITAWTTNNSITQNLDTSFNQNVIQYIGAHGYVPDPEYFNGYMSEVYMIDGQQLTPSSFGETDTLTGIWKPKAYTGSFGTNGFYQKYANSAALGTDSSGNGNNFTVNNLTSVDQSTDTPTNNYSTVNPLAKNANNVGATPTEGALTITASGQQACGTIGIPITSGTKWYYEFKGVSSVGSTTDLAIGWATDISAGNTGAANWASAGTLFFMSTNGQIYNAGWGAGGTSWTTGDIIGCAVDLSANSIKWYKNGTLVYTLSSISFVGTFIYPFSQWDSGSAVGSFNFGSPTYAGNSYTDAAGYGNFSYAVPGGHYALNTKNLADYG
jgi:hypothetical protein